jgi:hypothetical protein
MTMSRRMKRRTFLAAGAGVGLSLAWRSIGSLPFLDPSPSRSERLAGLLAHQEGAHAVGLEYLRVMPQEASQTVLIARVVERLPGGFRTLDEAGDGRLRDLLLRATVEDFGDLETVELQGWVLARTEARLCALASLHESPEPA